MEADAPLWLLFLAKSGLTASALIASGLVLHAGLGVVEREARGRVLRAAAGFALILLLCGAARLVIVNAQLGGDMARAFDPEMFPWVWGALGEASLALAAGVAAVLLAAVARAGWLAIGGAVLIAASFGLAGHSAAIGGALAPASAAIHVLLASFWIAAPMTLSGDRLGHEGLHGRLTRFSRLAIYAIPLLFVLGLWLALRLTGGPPALYATDYGRLLLIKLAAATLALGLGAINQRRITRLVLADPARGRLWLKRTLLADALLFATAVLAVCAATTFTGPPS